MAIIDSLIPIDFGMGIDQGTDEKQVIVGKLLGLKNVRLNKAKRLSKGYGYARVGTSGVPLLGDLLGTRGNELFVQQLSNTNRPDKVVGPGNINYQANGVLADYVARNVECTMAVDDARSDNGEQIVVDSATVGNITLNVWQDALNGFCYYKLVDDSDGSVMIRQAFVTGSNNARRRPRVLAANNHFFVGVHNPGSNTIEIHVMDPAINSGIPASPVTTLSNVDPTNPNWDWAFDEGPSSGADSSIAIVYNAATTLIRFAIIDANTHNTGTYGALVAQSSFSGSATNSIAVVMQRVAASPGSFGFWILWHNATLGLSARFANISSLALGTAQVLDAAVTTVENICGVMARPSGVFCFLTQTAAVAQTYNRFVTARTYTQSGTVLSAVRFTFTQRSLGLASKPTVLGTDRFYVLLTHESTLQKTYFLSQFNERYANGSSGGTSPGRIMARSMYGVAGGLTLYPTLPQMYQLASGEIACSIVRRERIFVSNGGITTFRFQARLRFSFATLGANRMTNLNGTCLITGGFLGMFDGGPSIVENGFFLDPENISTAAATSGGSLGDGTYQHIVVAEYVDAKGKVHRSAPSVPVTTVLSGGGGAGKITLTIPNIRVTNRDLFLNEGRYLAFLVVYRTEANKTIFYRSSTLTAVQNVITADTASYVDTVSDVSLISNETVYTQGGELDNFVPNGPTALIAGTDRVFCNDIADDGQTWFSKPLVDGEAVAFAAENSARMTNTDGPTTAYAVQDGNVIAFKQKAAYVMSGAGPDATGQSGAFSGWERIPTSGGCKRQAACVTTPLGTIVYGDKGFHLLGRDMSWTYIGKAVKDFESQDVRASVHLPDRKEARFVMTGGAILHFNYEFPDDQNPGQWYQRDFTALDAASTTDGSFYVIDSVTRTVYREDSTRFTDEALGAAGADRKVPISIETANISLAGVNGYQRARSIFLLGNFIDAHNLSIEIAYDGKTAFEPAPFVVSGATATAGGQPYRVRIDFRIQKCTSFRLRISDDGGGEALNLTAMTVLAAVKTGGAKLRTANKVG